MPIGDYVLDFYCPSARLGIEIDGGQHDEPERRAHDERRTAELAAQGIRVIRFWNSQIRENLDGVLERIRMELVGEWPPQAPSPRPSPARGEGVAG